MSQHLNDDLLYKNLKSAGIVLPRMPKDFAQQIRLNVYDLTH